MRIATWNVERLKHKRDLDKIYHKIEKVSADIIVLTETDMRLHPDYPFVCHTLPLYESRPGYYRKTENRVSIFSRYRCLKLHKTYDAFTAICAELETERGNLVVYGTIMGILGNRNETFMPDLEKQMEDIRGLSAQRHALCVIGDYNLSFCDSYYYTKDGRDLVVQTFQECGLSILTGSTPECIDHIAISKGFAKTATAINEWNLNKSLSDHKGIVIEAEILGKMNCDNN